LPAGALLQAQYELLPHNAAWLPLDEDSIISNICHVLKTERKVIVYSRDSGKRYSSFQKCQLKDYPGLHALSNRLPPETRWAWERLSTENFAARYCTAARFMINDAYFSKKSSLSGKPKCE
jgi:hypothetical protein